MRPLSARPDPAARRVGLVAARSPVGRLRTQARVHLLRPPARRAVRRGSGAARPAPGRGEPVRRGRGHALVPRGLRRVPRRRGGAARARSTSTGRSIERIELGEDGARVRRRARRSPADHPGAPRRRRVRPVRRPPAASRNPRRGVPRVSGDRGAVHALHRRAAARRAGRLRGSPPRARRRRIRSTTPPCTTSSTAAGSGCFDSRTASRARASRRRPSSGARAPLRGRRGGVGPSSLAAALGRRTIRRRSPHPALRPPAAAGVSRHARGGPGLGAAAVRRRVRGPSPLDGLSARAARHPAPRPDRRGVVGPRRTSTERSRSSAAGRSTKPTRPLA